MTIDQANAYFALHLQNKDWIKNDEARRIAALTMAQADIAGELNVSELDTEDLRVLGAICEQALWLLINPRTLDQAKCVIQSESVDGVGSRTYQSNAKAEAYISPRAERFIRMLRGSGSCRTIR